MMRIVILNTFPAWGGDEQWTINVGRGLQEKGHFVIISSRPGSATEQKAVEAGLQIFPFHIGPDIAFWKIIPFQKFLKKNRVNVVLCVQNRDVKIGGLAARLAGVPAIFSRQGLDLIFKKIYHKIAFTKYIDGIITNTKSIKELYESYGWFPENFIHVIYDGLEIPSDCNRLNLHTEFGLSPNSKVIIGTGRLSHQKRFDLLIDVAKKAKEDNLNWSFIIAGNGKLNQQLENKADKLGVGDMIKFIGFRDDVLTLMKSSDLFVLTSDNEGMSNALREAMGMGLPCVSTDVFGVSELFQNGQSGITVPRGDAQAIYQAIRSVFSDADLKSRIEKNAFDRIKSDFTMMRMIDQIERIFENRLKNSREPGTDPVS